MLGELTLPRARVPGAARLAILHTWLQYAVASGALVGVVVLCAIIASKSFFLGSDSANHYAHVWYISDQLFHHGRLPLHVHGLESGDALTFPYAVAPWLAIAPLFALIGDRAVTLGLLAGFVLYGYAATRARPALRDPRLLALIYANTFLIEGLVSFQLAFIWAVVFFFFFVEAIDHGRWLQGSAWAVLSVTTHPFAGGAAVLIYAAYAVARRPRAALPLVPALAVAALCVLPFALYIRTTPAAGTITENSLFGTLKFMARYRGGVIVLPLLVAYTAPILRPAFLPVFVILALVFMHRIDKKQVNTFGLDRNSHPFYAAFLKDPAFDPHLTYRVLEPNDREDGAYQLLRGGATLGQEFFDQSQFRRWWNSPDQYACFLGAKHIDVVLLEKDYPLKFSQNEDVRLHEFEQQGKARVVYRDPGGRFAAYSVVAARTEGSKISDCHV